MKKTMYVAPRFMQWSNLKMDMFGIPGSHVLAGVVGPPGNPGVLLVFDSKDALLKSYPNVQWSEVLQFEYDIPDKEEVPSE